MTEETKERWDDFIGARVLVVQNGLPIIGYVRDIHVANEDNVFVKVNNDYYPIQEIEIIG